MTQVTDGVLPPPRVSVIATSVVSLAPVFHLSVEHVELN